MAKQAADDLTLINWRKCSNFQNQKQMQMHRRRLLYRHTRRRHRQAHHCLVLVHRRRNNLHSLLHHRKQRTDSSQLRHALLHQLLLTKARTISRIATSGNGTATVCTRFLERVRLATPSLLLASNAFVVSMLTLRTRASRVAQTAPSAAQHNLM